jgi:phosphatidate cytidylyltransferase
MADLKLRFISALILGPLVLLIVWRGGEAFYALALLGCLLFLFEWLGIVGARPFSLSGLSGFLTLGAVAGLIYTGLEPWSLVAIAAGCCLSVVCTRFSRTGFWTAEGILYSSLALAALMLVRRGGAGEMNMFFLLAVVWITDIAAYFTGRKLGGPKLWPRVSPKKTWSGAIGGLVFGALGGLCVVATLGQGGSLGWFAFGLAISAVSQGGDLLESAIKRRFGVKDSGRLIPGHGGIMDRIDGLVAAAIFAVLCGLLFGGSLADPMSGIVFQ